MGSKDAGCYGGLLIFAANLPTMGKEHLGSVQHLLAPLRLTYLINTDIQTQQRAALPVLFGLKIAHVRISP